MSSTPLDLARLHEDPHYQRFRAVICAIARRKRDERLAEMEAEMEAYRVGCEEARPEREEEQPEYQKSRAA